MSTVLKNISNWMIFQFNFILKLLDIKNLSEKKNLFQIVEDNQISILTETATKGVIWKKAFFKISQNSKENTCTRVSFLEKLKKRLWHSRFPMNFAKFSRTSLLQNTSGRLLPFSILKIPNEYCWKRIFLGRRSYKSFLLLSNLSF